MSVSVKKTMFSCWCKCIIACMVFLSLSVYAKSPMVKLTDLHITSVSKNVRLIFSLNKSFKYHCFTLTKPDRLVVDFTNTKLALHISHVKLGHHGISNIRIGAQPNNTLRIVFNLTTAMKPKPRVLRLRGHGRYRLVVDLLSNKIIQPVKINFQKSANKKLRDAVVIIDPGHGGKDPGATGQLGTHEKNVVLSVGKYLYYLLKKQPGIDPKLTRTSDHFVPLRGRLRLAHKGWADMFVAIHADAYRNHSARGATVFALSRRGATSEAAHWLAQKENYSELMGGVDLEDKSYLLRSVLIDLSQTATIRESLTLGKYVMYSLSRIARLHSHRVEQAPFVVLKSPDIPSILVEVGFISNRHEELQLRSLVYRKKLAIALMHGIVNYLHKYPPPGTVLTVLYRKSLKHVVRRGENLTKIAKEYGTSVTALKHLNDLHNTALIVGQTLRVPK